MLVRGRSVHDALRGADADTQLGGDLLDALSLLASCSDTFLDDLRGAGPTAVMGNGVTI